MADEVEIKVTVDNKQAVNNLQNVNNALLGTTKNTGILSGGLKGLANSFGGFALKATAAGLALFGFKKAGEAVKSFVEQSAEFEKLQTRLVSLYQDAGKAEEVFRNFKKIASTTPFSLTEVVEAGATLKAFGLEAESTLKSVTDLAAFMGVDVVQASQAVGRAFAGGVGAADVLRERGVLNLIKSFKGIEDLTTLTLPEFREALLSAMVDPAAGIAGSTTLLSETFAGAVSNMGDAWEMLKDRLGSTAIPGIDTSLLQIAENTVRSITKTINFLNDAIGGNSTRFVQNFETNLAKANDTAARSISQFAVLSMQLQMLSEKTSLTNAENEKRKKIIEEINTKYAPYLTNLIQESDNYVDIANNVNVAKRNLQEYFKVKAGEAVVQDVEDQIAALSKVNIQLEDARALILSNKNTNSSAMIAAVKSADGYYLSLQQIEKQIENNKRQISELSNAAQRLGQGIDPNAMQFVINIDDQISEAQKKVNAIKPQLLIDQSSINVIDFDREFTLEVGFDVNQDSLDAVSTSIDDMYGGITALPEIDIKIRTKIEEEIAKLDQYRMAGLNVTDELNQKWQDYFNTLQAGGDAELNEYLYRQQVKIEADQTYFDQKKALVEQDHAQMLAYYDIAANTASEYIGNLVHGELNWKQARDQALSSGLKLTIKYFTDLAKQYIIDAITRKTIEKTAAASAIATSAVTGKAIAKSFIGAAALANTATMGAAGVAGSASLTATYGVAQAIANAATGAYIDESGKIHGAGTGTSDSVLAVTAQKQPILVSNGEMIMKAEAVSRYKPLLDKAQEGKIPRYASGGTIGYVKNPVQSPEFKGVIGLDELREFAGRTGNQVLDIVLKNWDDENTQRILSTYSNRGEIANLADMVIKEKRFEQYKSDMSGVEQRLDRAISSIDRLGTRLSKNRVASPGRINADGQNNIISQDKIRNNMVNNGYDAWSF